MHGERKKGLNIKDVKDISTEEAKQLYYEEFWLPTGASNVNDLREGYLLFDTAINSGPYESKKLYESSNGDIYKFLKDRKIFYDNLILRKPSQEENRQGWYNRLKDIENNMNEIVNKGYYSPPYQNMLTPYDENFKNININTDFAHYSPQKLQNIKNKYQYIKNKKGYPTGFAIDIDKNQLAQQNEFETFNLEDPRLEQYEKLDFTGYRNPLTENIRIYTKEDVGSMTKDEFAKNEKEIMAQVKLMKGMMPSNGDLQREVISGGNVVYINSYIRSDGTQVKGYYRRKVCY